MLLSLSKDSFKSSGYLDSKSLKSPSGRASRLLIISSVSSVSAAILETPLAAGNDILTVLPAPLADDALEKQINMADAFAIIKLGRHFSRIRRLLEKLGLLENSVYIERATMKNERIVDIVDVVESDVPYFSIILVHKRNKAWL